MDILIGFIAAIIFAIAYESWLEKNHGCCLAPLWSVILGTIDCFILVYIFDADLQDTSVSGILFFIAAILIALAILIFLFLRNLSATGSIFHGILMTACQVAIGFIIMMAIIMITQGTKKEKRQ